MEPAIPSWSTGELIELSHPSGLRLTVVVEERRLGEGRAKRVSISLPAAPFARLARGRDQSLSRKTSGAAAAGGWRSNGAEPLPPAVPHAASERSQHARTAAGSAPILSVAAISS